MGVVKCTQKGKHQFSNCSIVIGVTTFKVNSLRLSVCALKTPMDMSLQVRPLIFVMTSPILGPLRKEGPIKSSETLVMRKPKRNNSLRT